VFIPKGAIIDRVLVNVLSPLVSASGSAPGPVPPGTPAFGLARGYAVLAASAISNTGSSVLTGNVGEYPGTAVTGFPPGTFTGSLDVANAAAQAAKAAAQAAYTDLSTRSCTTIPSALDAQTLTAGVYCFASGAATLANSAGGTLTLNGNSQAIFVIKTASTLTTGAGGVPVITLTGGALASNVYWVVGSTATINSGSAGVFQGNIIAQTSITDTMGGTVNGSLVALTGAVTLSAASTLNATPLGANPGSATVALKVQTAADLKAASGISTFTGIMGGVPVGLPATSFALSADRELKLTVGGEALTAGKFDVFVEYWFGN
jgi:hypothetical protein